MIEILKAMFSPTKAAPVVAPEPIKCVGRSHEFNNQYVGKARLSCRCQCGTYTWQSYARRWDVQ